MSQHSRPQVTGYGLCAILTLYGLLIASAPGQEQTNVRLDTEEEDREITYTLVMLGSDGLETDRRDFLDDWTSDKVSYPDLGSRMAVYYLEYLPFDIQFEGGSALDFLSHIRRQWLNVHRGSPEQLRALLPVLDIHTEVDNFDGVTFPSIELRGMSLRGLNTFFQGLLPQTITFTYRTFPTLPKYARMWFSRSQLPEDVRPGEFWQTADKTHGVILRFAKGEQRLSVLSLRDLIPAYPVDEIVGALETAWRITGKVITTEVKFHEDTGVLLVRGSEEETAAANRVIASMRHSHEPVEQETSESLEQRIEALEKALEEAGGGSR